MKFGDPRLNLSQDIPPEAVRGFIVGPFRTLISSVISTVVVDWMGVKVPVKYGDSRSNHSRDMRLPHFVTNDDNDDVSQRTL